MSVQSLNHAYRKEIERISAMNPVDRYKAAQRAQDALKAQEVALAEVKRAACRELVQLYDWTGGDVAREFGLSRARGYQILAGE